MIFAVISSLEIFRRKIVALYDHQSRVLALILWHEPMDIPTASATSLKVSQRFP
jgi:hypothetical protein